MKTALTLLALLLPGAALAHAGPHHHPHGAEALWLTLTAGLAVAALGLWYFRGRK